MASEKKHKICYDRKKTELLERIIANVIHEINNQICIVQSNSDALNEYTKFLLKEPRKKSSSSKLIDIKADLPSLLEDNQQAIIKVKTITTMLRNFCSKDNCTIEKSVNIEHVIDFCLEVLFSEIKYKAVVDKKYGQNKLININKKEVKIFFLYVFIAILDMIEQRVEIYISNQDSQKGECINIEVIGPLKENFMMTNNPNIIKCLEIAKDLNINLEILKQTKGVRLEIVVPSE